MFFPTVYAFRVGLVRTIFKDVSFLGTFPAYPLVLAWTCIFDITVSITNLIQWDVSVSFILNVPQCNGEPEEWELCSLILSAMAMDLNLTLMM